MSVGVVVPVSRRVQFFILFNPLALALKGFSPVGRLQAFAILNAVDYNVEVVILPSLRFVRVGHSGLSSRGFVRI